MNFLKSILSFALLLNINAIEAKREATAKKSTQQPTVQPRPTRAAQARQQTSRPALQQKQPESEQTLQAQSYATALNIIRTSMPSAKVLKNNLFTQEFINFVTALDLSDIETTALLEAGINLHATWSNDNQQNKAIVASSAKSIQTILHKRPQPSKQQESTQQPAQQTQPIKKVAAEQPKIQKQPIIQEDIPTSAISIEQLKINNLIIALDPHKGDFAQKVGFNFSQVIIALFEKTSPIIMTSNILESIIKIKQQVGDQNLQKLRSTDIRQMEGFAQFLISSRNASKINSSLLVFLSNIDFDRKNFNCYLHKSTQLALIIPQQYIQANHPKSMNLDLNEQAQACGFNPAVMNAVTDLTSQNLMQQLASQQAKPINEEKLIPDLSAMFIPQKKHGQLISPERESKWCIYLIGHGMPAYLNLGFVRQQLRTLQSAYAPRKKNERRIVTSNPKAQATIKLYEKMVQGKENWPDSHMIPESANIAGITGESFKQLMKFFDSTINVAFLYYVTCFAGGSNQSFVNEILSSLDVNFIVCAAGIHESSVSISYSPQLSSKAPHVSSRYPSFIEFFKLLKLYFAQPETFVNSKAKKQDPIIRIIRTIHPEKIQANQPFVRFPGTEFFTPVSVNRNIKKLTKSLVKAHEIENRPINLSTTNIDTLIINAPRVNALLDLGKKKGEYHTALVAPSPKNIVPTYEAIRVFKNINIQDTLQSFLFNCVRLNAHFYPQTFVVEDLMGIFYPQSGINAQANSHIHNLIIHMQGVAGLNNAGTEQPTITLSPLKPSDIRTSRLGMNVYVAFEIGDTIYSTMFAIKNFENQQDLYKNIEKIKFTATPKNSANINELVKNFLAQKDITKIAKPITLQSLAQFINAKIDLQDPSAAIQSDSDNEALRKFAQKRVLPKTKKK